MPGQIIDGRFELLELAGAGGMGSVYRALDREAQRIVAVKVLTAGALGDVQRFEREARILGALEHPNIVRYVTHGATADARPYLVLEWLEGEDLEQRLAQKPLTLRETLKLARVLARALAAAHAGGVVHRDVKPANVFLVEGRVQSAKILDFGIARAIDGPRSMTRSGTAIGTPAYMAPEQARGDRDVDARADVFSLGCVVFECLTGEPPFRGKNVMAVLAKVLFEDAPRLSELAPDVPPPLDALVARMLAKEASERPATAEEVARALETILPPSVIDRPPAGAAQGPRPAELGEGEQRLMAVVVVAPDGARPRTIAEDDATVATEAARSPAELARIVAGFGARFAPLADGSSIAVLSSLGSATDLALRAARCALALRAQRPRLAVGLAIGRGVATSRVPVGEVIDRAATLVRRAETRSDARIRLDDLAAGLLDERFAVLGDETGLFLDAEREAGSGARRLLGRPTPCVGRARELGVIEASLVECLEERVARGVLLIGAAGMGKTRVRHELLRRIRDRDDEVEVLIGRGDPLAAGATLGILSSALRRAAGIADGEPVAVRRRKWHARAQRHAEGEALVRVTEFLGEIVGAPVEDPSIPLRAARADATLMGDQLARAFEDLVEAETRTRALVLVLEDFQWGDPSSVRLVEAAMRRCRDRAFFVLVIGRPEVASLVPSLARTFTQVALGDLSRRAAEQLVTEALGPDVSPELMHAIVSRAAGHPFFLEELVRCAASGDTAALPDTILAMLSARLEGLAPEPRRMLRAASVFGTVFWSGAVAKMLGGVTRTTELRDWMPILLAEELVERRQISRFPGEEEYVFRNALLRDAAYGSFVEGDRVLGHRLAAAWLEAAGERDPLVLAEHSERGGDPVRAHAYLARAAGQALRGHQVDRAIELVARARSLEAGAGDQDRGQLALLEAEAHRWRGDFALAERAAREAHDLLDVGTIAWFRAAEEAMVAGGRRADDELAIAWRSALADRPCASGAESARIRALCTAGRQLFHAGGYEMADALIARVRDDASHHALDPRAEAELERLLGARARHSGDLGADLEHYSRALACYERAGDAREACNAAVSVAFALVSLGQIAAGRAHLERARAEADRMGLAAVSARARQNLGLVLLAEGRAAEARAALASVIEDSRARGNLRFEGWTRVYAARARLAMGQPAEARDEATHAARLLDATPPGRAGALAMLALAHVALGEAAAAGPYAREALATLESFGGIEEFESLVWIAAIRSARARGASSEAHTLSAQAQERLAARAAEIGDRALREAFLTSVPENVELRSLASEASR